MEQITIQPARSRLRLRDLPRYGVLIRVVSARDLKARYKQSLLGPIWIGFQPLALLAAYIVGFRGVAHIATGHVPYVVFALAGVTLWSYFQAVAVAGTSSIVSNGALVAQTQCPRVVFPVAVMVSCLPSLLVPLVAALTSAAIVGGATLRWILLPVPLLWMFLVTLGMIAISSSITVRFRDMVQALPFLLQVAAFVVPVGYPVETLSSKLQILVSLNPLTGVIEAWRWLLLDGAHPYMLSIYLSAGIGLLLILGGWRIFALSEVKMADVI